MWIAWVRHQILEDSKQSPIVELEHDNNVIISQILNFVIWILEVSIDDVSGKTSGNLRANIAKRCIIILTDRILEWSNIELSELLEYSELEVKRIIDDVYWLDNYEEIILSMENRLNLNKNNPN
jgi:hypothetical protein